MSVSVNPDIVYYSSNMLISKESRRLSVITCSLLVQLSPHHDLNTKVQLSSRLPVSEVIYPWRNDDTTYPGAYICTSPVVHSVGSFKHLQLLQAAFSIATKAHMLPLRLHCPMMCCVITVSLLYH